MDTVWDIERRLWLEGAEAYDACMAPDCLMAFAGVGVLRGAEIVESLREAPRWREVTMSDRVEATPTGEVTVIAYVADAARGEGKRYRALCTSTYVLTGQRWTIAQHQQTPI